MIAGLLQANVNGSEHMDCWFNHSKGLISNEYCLGIFLKS